MLINNEGIDNFLDFEVNFILENLKREPNPLLFLLLSNLHLEPNSK